ncbi:hypothetical protein [Inquilinus sp. Marseille-Q2685]|uniref:hypothetical protein n=1 Tax=Inquilinus sp. Marseille-Q2685 TaxID=2866581 RepID=UPI001CE4AAA2|nr:hypothetical protein [Inquilinus sp. Marseille-Q2685]
MPWFCFTADFDFRPSRRLVLAYRAGATLLVPTAAAEAAEAAGAGRRVAKPDPRVGAEHERP